MKIPKVVGHNKIRDAKILSLYAEGHSMEEVGDRFGISSTRVGTIIYRNRALLELDRKYEKVKRVSHLKRLLRLHPNKMEKKSTLDIIERLQDESEPKQVESTHTDTKIVIIRSGAGEQASGISVVRPIVAEAMKDAD